MFKKIIASFIIAAMAAAPALAGGLSKDAAARFVATLADLKPIMEEIADKDETLGGFDVTPKRGEPYAPYTDGMAVLKERDPALHKKMRAITKETWLLPRGLGIDGRSGLFGLYGPAARSTGRRVHRRHARYGPGVTRQPSARDARPDGPGVHDDGSG